MTYTVQKGWSLTRLRWEWVSWSRTPPTEQRKEKKERLCVSAHSNCRLCLNLPIAFSTIPSITIRGTHTACSRTGCGSFNELLIIARCPSWQTGWRHQRSIWSQQSCTTIWGRNRDYVGVPPSAVWKHLHRHIFFLFFFHTGFPSGMSSSRLTALAPQEEAWWMGRHGAELAQLAAHQTNEFQIGLFVLFLF